MGKPDYSVIGKRKPRIDAVAKVTGEATYTDDMSFPGMLYAKILRSPHAHARIVHIDTGRAERLPGVRAVVTGKDTPGIAYGAVDTERYLPPHMAGQVPVYPNDKHPLAMEKVRYIGDEVAAVAAVDEATAIEALELIDVVYETLPAVFDPVTAMADDAPKIHDFAEKNICNKIYWDFGDVEKGFDKADHIREDRFTTGPVTHTPLEPRGCVALFDQSGKLTVWTSTQSPYIRRQQLSKALNMSESSIRVITPCVGGGFGGKVCFCEPDFHAALLSRITRKPVKITYTREEEFIATSRRHPMIIELKTGVTKDGSLTAIQCHIIADGGAYTHTGPVVMYLAGAFLATAYRLPNIRFSGLRVFTNNMPCGPQRGHGAVQPRFAAESQLDMIAEDLGIDPAEIRLKNILQPGDTTANKFLVRTCGLKECIELSSEQTNWKQRRAAPVPDKGIGISVGAFISGMAIPPHTSSGALVKLHEDGAVTLLTGVTDIGQGSDTILAQIVADELGVAFEDVRVISSDTELTPVHAGSYSSRGAYWGGKAVKAAALDAKRQLFQVAASLLEANPDDLEARDRMIFVKGSPDRAIPTKGVVLASMMESDGNPIMGRGFYKANVDYVNFETGEGNVTGAYSFESQIAEVDVDFESGKARLLKMTIGHDTGTTINPMSVEGQLEGSVSMGMGQALFEESVSREGLIMNPSFVEYGLHTAMDMADVACILVDTENPDDPFEPKEAGEGTQVATPSAIANAIYNATGVRIKELPITREKILRELRIRHIKITCQVGSSISIFV
ncbi:putative 4-hydroxybenzoyl-CoA reductase, alpha subunit [uncultured Desulfobacterium sp.]|uniref:Putative 4-hydroxybenzoyl-CoA reductase, alpha subunit n=1 Tax=uncultured Desulfobacterium sp. TaxID=201089 RepID=A0A445N138_9BACT|nr:putative 4-hydroxybenzoyl-CoA reductase, alpha subunit [uncultured Desulfobacterium sp.]